MVINDTGSGCGLSRLTITAIIIVSQLTICEFSLNMIYSYMHGVCTHKIFPTIRCICHKHAYPPPSICTRELVLHWDCLT